MQPIVAVPAFLCADSFNKVLPFCTGFAAGCMIWMVIAEVLPDAFKVMYFNILIPSFYLIFQEFNKFLCVFYFIGSKPISSCFFWHDCSSIHGSFEYCTSGI